MKRILNNKKGFTLVELLAVIVVLAIVMGISAVAITGVLENTRKNAFKSSAEQYIEAAKSQISADLITNRSTLNCTGTSTASPTEVTSYALNAFTVQSGGKSPYTNQDYTGLTVKVLSGDQCASFTYKIFLTDGTNCIGTKTAPVSPDSLTVTTGNATTCAK